MARMIHGNREAVDKPALSAVEGRSASAERIAPSGGA